MKDSLGAAVGLSSAAAVRRSERFLLFSDNRARL